jgi:RNA polymerase sigma-70 factor, ECF subfamily
VSDFSAMYSKYAPDVYRFALHLSGDRHEAEDLTSEAFVRAWTAAEPIRAATVKGYLFTIARNLFLQRLRKRKRDVVLEDVLHDPRPGPHANAESATELDAVLAGLQKLPEVDRAALLMRAMEDLPYDEIARALGISLASVKVKIHRARLALVGLRDESPGTRREREP